MTTDIVAGFRSAIEGAGLELGVRIDLAQTAVFVDRAIWENIVLNLLSNALKFTLQASIRVELAANDDVAILVVRFTAVELQQAATRCFIRQ